jgi:hypothetical protein
MKPQTPKYAPQLTRKQRREKIATHLLSSILAGRDPDVEISENKRRWIIQAVSMADDLMLYLDEVNSKP